MDSVAVGDEHKAKECPAPVPIIFCLLIVIFGMGLGSGTLSSVPSPHIPCSFHPHDTATPSAAEERVSAGGWKGRGRGRE